MPNRVIYNESKVLFEAPGDLRHGDEREILRFRGVHDKAAMLSQHLPFAGQLDST